MKIDCFTHVLPQDYYKAMKAKMTGPDFLSGMIEGLPELHDMEARKVVMNQYGIDQQVITMASPPIETVIDSPVDAAELAMIGNDGIAEIANKDSDRFIPVGALALNSPDSMAREAERCVRELGMKGMMIYSSAKGLPMDGPEFADFYQVMADMDLPIWLHPTRSPSQPDYRGEHRSQYFVWQVFGWPYETTVCMSRLVFSGLFDKHPDIKIITHHAGGMVPFFGSRIEHIYESPLIKEINEATEKLEKPVTDYFRMFYNDTAIMGSTGGLMAAYDFFGCDRLLLASDAPFDGQGGADFTRDTLKSVEDMQISSAERGKIYSGNLLF